jgi:alcohol dehydrogenase class IV
MSFSNVGVALVHALEYPVGGAVHCSHGAGNGLLLPYVMRYNLQARRKEFATIARLLGEDVSGLDENEAAERAVTAVDRLRADVGVPGKLREFGAKEEQLAGFAEKAFAIKRLVRVNPRTANQADLEGILRAAY